MFTSSSNCVWLLLGTEQLVDGVRKLELWEWTKSFRRGSLTMSWNSTKPGMLIYLLHSNSNHESLKSLVSKQHRSFTKSQLSLHLQIFLSRKAAQQTATLALSAAISVQSAAAKQHWHNVRCWSCRATSGPVSRWSYSTVICKGMAVKKPQARNNEERLGFLLSVISWLSHSSLWHARVRNTGRQYPRELRRWLL